MNSSSSFGPTLRLRRPIRKQRLLQELPKPVTKLTWTTPLWSAQKQLKSTKSRTSRSRGGEHGKIYSNVIDIELSNSKVTAAAWNCPAG